MNIHIGEIVSEILTKQRLSKTEFAVLLHYSKQNINSLLKKESWNTDTLLRTCEVLNENIFLTIANSISLKKGSLQSQDAKKIVLEKKELEILKKEIIYLKEINNLLKKRNK